MRLLKVWWKRVQHHRVRARERRYAKSRGFFWLPCPICGEHFGGHEAQRAYPLMILRTGVGIGQCVCPKLECAVEADKRNVRDWPDHKYYAGLSRSFPNDVA